MKRLQAKTIWMAAVLAGALMMTGCGGGGSGGGSANHKPVANAKSVTINKNRATPIELSATDTDGDRLDYNITQQPVHGHLTKNPLKLTYTPDKDYTGNDSFKFQVNDGRADSDVATVTLDVISVAVPFKMEVDTSITYNGSSGDKQFEIPTNPNLTYSYDVDCDDDGSFELTNQTANTMCNYTTAGKHTIAIRGDFPAIYFNQKKDKKKLLSVKQWGSIAWESFCCAFKECHNMTIDANDTPNLSNVQDMTYGFSYTYNLDSDLGNWDTSNITNMIGMLGFARKFNQDIGSWDTSNVTNMAFMLQGAEKFNQYIGDWNISKVTDISNMFYWAYAFDQDISKWDTSNVIDMQGVFGVARSFNQDISGWDTSKATNMKRMFFHAEKFNQDISGWDTSKVTTMREMFESATAFSGHDLSGWDASNVTDHTNFCKNWGSGNTPPGGWTCP